MKILNILTVDLCLDGISNSVMNYYRNINKDLIETDFVAQSVLDSIKDEIESNGNKVYVIPQRFKKPIQYMLKLSKLIKKNKYDIVQAHGSSAILCLEMIAAKMAGCKIRIAHSRNTQTRHEKLDKLLRPIFYKTYTHGFACGKDAGIWLFRNRKFEIINNGKNFEEFEYNNIYRKLIREKYKLENKIVLGHVGTFNYQKNHEYLIDIFFKLNKKEKGKYKLVLLGDGVLQDQIKEKVKKLNLQDDVLFIGRTKQIPEWLSAMDIMIFPSRFEGFPNVLVEWQIAGLPCIISDKITKDVKLTTLVQFESIDENTNTWVEKVENIRIEDRNKNKQVILNQIREKGFDIKENAKNLEIIYQKLMSGIKKEEL